MATKAAPAPPAVKPVTAKIEFTGNTVGLIVRGKEGPDHAPDNLAQHADCVLPDGSPIGFFGEPGDHSGSGSGLGSWNRSGMNMRGVVYEHDDFVEKYDGLRRPYVDIALARLAEIDLKSTLLIVDAVPPATTLFAEYWNKVKHNPSGFFIVGANCSTRASAAFVYAKLLPNGIPGLDTPDKLYRQLVSELPWSTKSYSGYLGFSPKAGGGYTVLIEVARKDPTRAT